jgi:hypothetical protein
VVGWRAGELNPLDIDEKSLRLASPQPLVAFRFVGMVHDRTKPLSSDDYEAQIRYHTEEQPGF